jgi:DNA-binding NtrC family response regulator
MARAWVLVVDDDVGMVDTLADILSANGHKVGLAYSGPSALDMIRSTPFDVALMDIQMPGLNGVEVLKLMRDVAPEIAVIMMTAFTRHELIEEAKRSAAAVLSKPLDIEQVLGLIATAGSRPAEPDAAPPA